MPAIAVPAVTIALLAVVTGASDVQNKPIVPEEKTMLWNGVLQNVATKCSASSGKICLQSEGTPIEYRNIYIEPLE